MWTGSNCLRTGSKDGKFTAINRMSETKRAKILEQINDYKLPEKLTNFREASWLVTD
jgi:hypothetical protein